MLPRSNAAHFGRLMSHKSIPQAEDNHVTSKARIECRAAPGNVNHEVTSHRTAKTDRDRFGRDRGCTTAFLERFDPKQCHRPD
jgi:hypothetical protein